MHGILHKPHVFNAGEQTCIGSLQSNIVIIIVVIFIPKTLVIVQCFNLVLIHESFFSADEEPGLSPIQRLTLVSCF